MQRRSDPEVLLLEAERLALVVVFVRVQDSRDRLGFFGLANGGFVVTGVELGQVEADLAARRPKTDVAASARSRESEWWVTQAGSWHVAEPAYLTVSVS